MTIVPYGPWVYIKVDPPIRRTAGGLYLPAGNLDERLGQRVATVVAVGAGKGRGKDKKASGVKPGDRIYLRGFLSELHKPGGMFENNDHCLIHQDDVLGLVEDENAGK